MSLSKDQATALMALADGELEGPSEAEALALAERSPEAARVLLDMHSSLLGDLLREGSEWRALEANVDGTAARVVARATRAPEARAQVVARSRLRSRVGAGAALGVALVASLALVVAGRQVHRTGSDSPAVGLTAQNSPVPTLPPETGIEGVEVDDIDSPNHGISVFEIAMENSPASVNPARGASVVIWVDEGEGEP